MGSIGALSNIETQVVLTGTPPAIQIGLCLLSTLFDGLGFLVTYQYSAIGLRIVSNIFTYTFINLMKMFDVLIVYLRSSKKSL